MMFLKRLFALKNNGSQCTMCSMGGVGSTALARHIGSIADKTIREHTFSPSVYDSFNQIRIGYMVGNPYNSVLSIFRRDYQQMHVKAMHANSGTKPANLRSMSLDEYLERGVDEFFIERQFNNWVNNPDPKHPTIIIRYELLSENIDQILGFFECDKPFAVKTRKSSWTDQPTHIQKGLEAIYGPLHEKIEALPGIKILMPKHSIIENKLSASSAT